MLPIIQLKAPSSGANASNSGWRIQIKPELKHFRAILAQELCEFWWKWKYLRIFVKWIPYFQREMELLGHEVEAQWAYMFDKADLAKYRYEEARALKHGYKCFADYDLDLIIKLMKRKEREAKLWILANKEYVIKKDKRNV